jgi:galactose mutarotase-like enzyme
VTGRRRIAGFEALTLSSEQAGLEAAFVPGAGMVGCSLLHDGEELLGQRGGLARYAAEHSTMGIPILYPWANRVTSRRFDVAGREIDLESHPGLVRTDSAGLPIHGLLSAATGWEVERHEATGDGDVLAASFDFGDHPDLLEAFPFPHRLEVVATLAGMTLSIETIVRASAGVEVPVAFGFHPYLTLPGVERTAWEIEVPVTERLVLDQREIPTGERSPVQVEGGPLGDRTFDDEYVAPTGSAPMTLAGGGRRIKLSLGEGYPVTQVYAPADDDVVAFEPMTAPTNALVDGGSELAFVQPGESFRTAFSIAVERST